MEDIILIIVLYVIGTLVADKANSKKRKKKKKREDVNMSPPDFEIPTLKRDGSLGDMLKDIFSDPKPEPALNDSQEPVNEPKIPPPKTPKPKVIVQETRKPTISLDRDTVREGIILAEILGKPLAKRRLKRF